MPPKKRTAKKPEPKSDLIMTVGDRVLHVPFFSSLTLDEHQEILLQTRQPAEVWWGPLGKQDQTVGRVHVSVYWWISARRDGQPNLPYSLVKLELEDEFPVLSIQTSEASEVDDPES